MVAMSFLSDAVNFLSDAVLLASSHLRPHARDIATAMAATLLFLYGGGIHGRVRRAMQRYPFLVRLALFTLIVTFGYGMLSVCCTVLAGRLLRLLPDLYLAPCVAAAFLCIGLLADLKRKM